MNAIFFRTRSSVILLIVFINCNFKRSSSFLNTKPLLKHQQQRIFQTTISTRACEAVSTITSTKQLQESRRSFFDKTVGIVLSTSLVVLNPQHANALPMITPEEFNIILRDSARSIDVVEFSGPKSENVRVVLTDGTSFGLQGIVESSTDPRSPLKIAATCRENQVRTKFVDLEAALASTPKRKVVYYNVRVQEAAAKEREKELRIQNDENNRIAELERMSKQ